MDKLKGGLGDKKTINDIAKKHNVSIEQIEHQLSMGVRVEMEHTNNEKIAREIAIDHLMELPDYYSKLSKMESGLHENRRLIKKIIRKNLF